jgi:hypothetical protein
MKTKQVDIRHCDCIKEMKSMANNPVHSIVIELPKELFLSGKSQKTTKILNTAQIWRRAGRILKPSAHLLVIICTRRHDHTFCTTRNAVFRIRLHTIGIYRIGILKFHNISKAAKKAPAKKAPAKKAPAKKAPAKKAPAKKAPAKKAPAKKAPAKKAPTVPLTRATNLVNEFKSRIELDREEIIHRLVDIADRSRLAFAVAGDRDKPRFLAEERQALVSISKIAGLAFSPLRRTQEKEK